MIYAKSKTILLYRSSPTSLLQPANNCTLRVFQLVYVHAVNQFSEKDADRWSSKLRSWEAGGSHGLLANGEQWSPVEDGEDLHVPRPAETSAILHFRVRGPIPHGPHTQRHLQSQELNDHLFEHDQRTKELDREGRGGRDRHFVHSSLK
ncbi:uncharacterized protein LOC108002504 [Apis cerana]|uniref:uncharacterized protein LOC108002504 n=1 Tax=Apis cerana TaxID=7461 RepID=UPI002B227C03|nr:uncharacterized protein LOC108002504 [Apis cerana]